MQQPLELRRRLTPIQWLICAIAAIGFAFDIYEILMLPLIVRPALLELTGAAPGSPQPLPPGSPLPKFDSPILQAPPALPVETPNPRAQ